MKVLFLILALVLYSCQEKRNRSEGRQETETISNKNSTSPDSTSFKDYNNKDWGFALEHPTDFKVYEGQLPGNAPVINFYHHNTSQSPPFGIHEEPEISYIAFLPNGYGVDGPNGKRTAVVDWDRDIPLSFNIDQKQSTVYLLENNEPWAYHLVFHVPPEGWEDYGGIFVHFGVKNFKAECFNRSGEKIPMRECDPLAENDIEISGEIVKEQAQDLTGILESLYFFDDTSEKQPISNLIQVEKPSANDRIESPLRISGKARGQWFFEGVAPFKLVNKNYRTLAEGIIETQEGWMTENFVPFEAKVEFNTPVNYKRGYLIFNKSNASGKPEMDRSFRIPVNFSQE